MFTENCPGPSATQADGVPDASTAGAFRPTAIGHTTTVVKAFFGDSCKMAYVGALVVNFFMGWTGRENNALISLFNDH